MIGISLARTGMEKSKQELLEAIIHEAHRLTVRHLGTSAKKEKICYFVFLPTSTVACSSGYPHLFFTNFPIIAQAAFWQNKRSEMLTLCFCAVGWVNKNCCVIDIVYRAAFIALHSVNEFMPSGTLNELQSKQ